MHVKKTALQLQSRGNYKEITQSNRSQIVFEYSRFIKKKGGIDRTRYASRRVYFLSRCLSTCHNCLLTRPQRKLMAQR